MLIRGNIDHVHHRPWTPAEAPSPSPPWIADHHDHARHQAVPHHVRSPDPNDKARLAARHHHPLTTATASWRSSDDVETAISADADGQPRSYIKARIDSHSSLDTARASSTPRLCGAGKRYNRDIQETPPAPPPRRTHDQRPRRRCRQPQGGTSTTTTIGFRPRGRHPRPARPVIDIDGQRNASGWLTGTSRDDWYHRRRRPRHHPAHPQPAHTGRGIVPVDAQHRRRPRRQRRDDRDQYHLDQPRARVLLSAERSKGRERIRPHPP